MKAMAIYDAALALLGEAPETERSLDYRERAPYLIAAFCCECASVDRDYRESHRLAPQGDFSDVYVSLDDDFPLCKRLVGAASHYLASMLVMDEDESLSEKLFEKYCDTLSRAVSEIPYVKGKTKAAYAN